jgi:hypothetical protein
MASPKLAVVATAAIHTIAMVLEKETPGTWRYMEVDEDGNKKHFNPVMGSAYLKKSAWAKAPAKLTIVITPED